VVLASQQFRADRKGIPPFALMRDPQQSIRPVFPMPLMKALIITRDPLPPP
jgi:hypothetical protein